MGSGFRKVLHIFSVKNIVFPSRIEPIIFKFNDIFFSSEYPFCGTLPCQFPGYDVRLSQHFLTPAGSFPAPGFHVLTHCPTPHFQSRHSEHDFILSPADQTVWRFFASFYKKPNSNLSRPRFVNLDSIDMLKWIILGCGMLSCALLSGQQQTCPLYALPPLLSALYPCSTIQL